MIAVDDVYASAVRYAAPAEGEQTQLMRLCRAAVSRLQKDLADGVDEAQCIDSLVCGAALLAAADFLALHADSGVQSFSAGPISVTQNDGARAKRMREEAALLLAPWCRGAFRFLGVRA